MAVKLSKKTKQVQKVVKKAPVKQFQQANGNKVAMPKGKYVEGTGRRKTGTARVRLYESKTAGNSDFLVNGMAAGNYFTGIANAAVLYTQPFQVTGTKGDFAVTAQVKGSGSRGQLAAVVHGIARALVLYDPAHKSELDAAGLLTRDDRMKETRKPGRGGKARRKRQSPRR